MDIKIIKFSKGKDTVNVFNSNNAARWAGEVYIINKITNKREILLVLRDNDVEKYNILNADIWHKRKGESS